MPILRAKRADLELARQAITEIHGRPQVDDAALADFLSRPSSYLLLASEGGRAVGSLSGHAILHAYRSQPQFILYEIDVLPKWRNRGIAKALVERFTAEARASGAFEVWVLANQSNEAAMALYHSAGFRRQHHDDVMFSLALEISS